MGCAFDLYSTSWNDRSYVATLLVFAWFIPLIVIFTSYIGIIYHIRHSTVKNILFHRNYSFKKEEDDAKVTARRETIVPIACGLLNPDPSPYLAHRVRKILSHSVIGFMFFF